MNTKTKVYIPSLPLLFMAENQLENRVMNRRTALKGLLATAGITGLATYGCKSQETVDKQREKDIENYFQ